MRLTENILLDNYPVWSPDGSRIAYMASPWDDYSLLRGQLRTMASDGSDVRLLTPSLKNVGRFPPVWSPDGKHIAFITIEFGIGTHAKLLYTVKSDGSALTRIGETKGVPSWSPDGSEMVFPAIYEGETGVYAVRPDGDGLRLVTPMQTDRVAWSPDGDRILLSGDAVYTVRPDGKDLLQIFEEAGAKTIAAWSPDGSRIEVHIYPENPGPLTNVLISFARDGTDSRVLLQWASSDRGDGRSRLTPGSPTISDGAESCDAGDAVADPGANPGLVRDCEILLSFRDSSIGPSVLNWSVHIPMSSWEGVVVGGDPLRVLEVALRDEVLSGPIPPELRGLEALRRLELTESFFSKGGQIPLELGELTELRILRLKASPLEGFMPRVLSALTKLEALTLIGPGLGGAILPELGGLTKLKELSLSASGGIPPELGNLVDLQSLSISGDGLSGSIPPELGALANLRRMYVGNTGLDGSIPKELGNLIELQQLDLSRNELTGRIPPELGDLINLLWLDLHRNELTGRIPPELGNLMNLLRVSITSNRLSGCIPKEFPNAWDRVWLRRCEPGEPSDQ